MTLKKSRRMAIIGFILSIIVVVIVYFGEKAIYDFLINVFRHVKMVDFLRNFLQIEHVMIYTKYMILAVSIVIVGLIVTGLILTHTSLYRRVVVGGCFFFAAGLLEMVALGVSVLGWFAGCLLLMSGIMCIKAARDYL